MKETFQRKLLKMDNFQIYWNTKLTEKLVFLSQEDARAAMSKYIKRGQERNKFAVSLLNISAEVDLIKNQTDMSKPEITVRRFGGGGI